jgi:hypothetical protein
MRARASRSAAESAAVIGGPSGFQIWAGARSITHAPRTRPMLAARLSGVEASMRTTGPRTILPPVPAVQAQLCPVRFRVKGAVIRKLAGPRSHVTPNVQGSSAAVSP